METAVQQPALNTLSVLNADGDMKIEWDPQNADQVTAAKSTFKAMKDKGYAAFKLSATGGQGEQIRDFDATAQRIIMVPAIRGG